MIALASFPSVFGYCNNGISLTFRWITSVEDVKQCIRQGDVLLRSEDTPCKETDIVDSRLLIVHSIYNCSTAIEARVGVEIELNTKTGRDRMGHVPVT